MPPMNCRSSLSFSGLISGSIHIPATLACHQHRLNELKEGTKIEILQ
jgi:hypothetical protein